MFWLVLIGYILPLLIVVDGIQATFKVIKSEGEKVYLGHLIIAVGISIVPIANIAALILYIHLLLDDEEGAAKELSAYSYMLKLFYKEI